MFNPDKYFWVIVLFALALTYVLTGFKTDKEIMAPVVCQEEMNYVLDNNPNLKGSVFAANMYVDCIDQFLKYGE